MTVTPPPGVAISVGIKRAASPTEAHVDTADAALIAFTAALAAVQTSQTAAAAATLSGLKGVHVLYGSDLSAAIAKDIQEAITEAMANMGIR